MIRQDGWYDRTKPWDSMPEQRLSATLGELAGASAEEIEAIRPPIPNIAKFAPRYGYDRTPPTIYDCFNLPVRYPTNQRDFTHQQPGYSGSSVQSLGSM